MLSITHITLTKYWYGAQHTVFYDMCNLSTFTLNGFLLGGSCFKVQIILVDWMVTLKFSIDK
jgi:hypothetical protein